MQPEYYTIGRLARAGGVHVETVRYYQRRRLLAVPVKRARGFRYYGPETLERLRFIRRAQALGLSLEDIRQLLGLDRKRACGTTRALAAQRLALVETKLRDLAILRDGLVSLIQECDERGGSSCPILTRLSSENEARFTPTLSEAARPTPGAERPSFSRSSGSVSVAWPTPSCRRVQQ
jgi:MerR family mercuric resistance operon transcriptional regulator